MRSHLRPSILGLAVCVACANSAVAQRQPAEELPPTDAARPLTANEPGYLGAITDDRQETSGVRVLQVVPGSPAARGGLRPGDLIHEAGGKTIRSMNDLGRVLGKSTPGSRVSFQVERNTDGQGGSEVISIDVTLGARPSAGQRAFPRFGRIDDEPSPTPLAEQPLQLMLGIRAVQLDRELRQRLGVPVGRGAVVTSVVPDSVADRAGIAPQMVLVAVDNRAIESPDDLARRLAMAGPERPIELAYYAGDRLTRVRVMLPRFPAEADRAEASEAELFPTSPNGTEDEPDAA